MSKMQTMLRAALEETTTEEIIGEEITMNDDIVVVEEINTAETELRMTEEAIDVLEETEESLEEITAKMEELVENDEATEEAVMFLNMALNVTMRNAGADSVVAGNESFGDHKGALQAGLEAAEESKEGVLAAIKKFIVEMWNKLTNWFKSIFTAVGRLKKGAEIIAKSDLKGTPDKDEVEIGKKAAKLMIDGKVVDNVGNEVMKLAALTGKIGDTNAYIGSVKKLADAVLDEIESPSGFKVEEGLKFSTATPSETIGAKLDDFIDNMGKHFGVSSKKEDGEELLGQVHFVYKDENSKFFNISPVRLVPSEKAKSGTEVKLKALEAKDIKTMAGAIHKLAEAMEKMDKGNEVLKKFSKDYSAKYDEVAKSIKAQGAKFKDRAKTYVTMRLIRALVKDTHKPIAALTSHTFSVLSAAYAYTLASKKNLKEA